MIQIKDTLISQDVIEKNFYCDLTRCKGACCVKGDAGAPLQEEEVEILPRVIEKIKPYLSEEGVETINRHGTHVVDNENETVTPLINGKECAYVVFEDNIARCGIEKAFFDGATKFRKPISCHLYPIRIKKYEKFIAVNYDQWDICEPARKKGREDHISVYKFLGEALVRRFGMDWYKHLKMVVTKMMSSSEAEDHSVQD
ncbi:hypothetical protein ES703_114637 [subsurface metagenome]